MVKKLNINFYDSLFALLPLSIIFGPAVSLTNIFLLILVYFFKYFQKDHLNYILKNKAIILFFLLNLYLIFNTLISIEPSSGIFRNFGFIRFIFLFIAINYLFHIKKYDFSSFKIWTVIFLIVVFDVYFERYNGTNILGFGSEEQDFGRRVISFFKDEPIAGSYLSGLLFIVAGYIFTIFKNKNRSLKIIPALLLLIFLSSVLITGERSNTIKVFAGFLLFVFFLDYFKLKFKLLFSATFIIIFFIALYQSEYLKERYIEQMYNLFFTSEVKAQEDLKKNQYLRLYKSGLSVFQKHPVFGVGNKNYRVETCHEDKHDKFDYYCTTHPHQIYIEFLSEHGIVGTVISLSVFFIIIFKILRQIIDSQNYIQIGAFIYIITNFLPIIPSGAFFSDFNITFFMLNLSLMYAVNSKTNIFERNLTKGR